MSLLNWLKRVKRVRHFFAKPASGQVLRRDSLVLQLTSVMETFMSTNPKGGDAPILVAIQQGKAHDQPAHADGLACLNHPWVD